MAKWIRSSHRWVAMTFLVIVIVNMAAFAINQAQPWLYYLPLPFLFWLMLTGLYMFVQPYLLRRRSGGAT
ncbi:MAG: hypothetical protein J0I48_08315 [Devosia sp.]|mgnify:CR=1 FL=1|jgi:hypothetical protein|uniref:hypothetical protein n=1 Tax=unclassified Devosia TaxID=196773 RepID=UPI0009287F00|nr:MULTISPECIES: hypothetical protein [unclassified Devosia]MBL8599260.1 hypothetical protein [Devosia sp.]MBN9346191.1 hypothetical protein [Devosia sp.]OJX50425.1 MAG: hypothetical protein BGO81_04940 [Devosia sp. 66-22]